MPNSATIEAGLVTTIDSVSALFDTSNLIAHGFDEVVRYLLSNPLVDYGGYTMFGGGGKSELEPLIWTWNIRLVFLIRAADDTISTPEAKLQTLLSSLNLDQWRKISNLNNTCRRSEITGVGEPELISYNNVPFYRMAFSVNADVRYADAWT